MATVPSNKQVKTVTINYTDPAPGQAPQLKIFNDLAGNVGEIQFKGRGGSFDATSNLAWNTTSQTLNVRGNMRLTGNILANVLGNPSYLKITGGFEGDVLTTDGNGNLRWDTVQTGSNYGNSEIAAYLPTFTGNLKAGNANLGNTATANHFIGSGNLLTGFSNIARTGNYLDLNNKPTLVTNLNSLSDVTITSLVNGQSLTYDGNQWINANVNIGVTSYNNLTDKPIIPTKTSDITNDSGYVTLTQVQNYVNSLINIDGGSASAEFTSIIDGGNA